MKKYTYNIGGRDIQIMLDVICAENGVVGTQKGDCTVQEIPIYFSNNDIVSKEESTL